MTKITKRQVYYLCQAHTRRSKGDYKRYLGSLAQRLKQVDLVQPLEHEGDSQPTEAESAESVSTMPIARSDRAMGSLDHVLARPDHAFLRAMLGLKAHLDEEGDHAAVVRRGFPYHALNPPTFCDL